MASRLDPGERVRQIAEDFRRRAESSPWLRVQLGLKRVFDFVASLVLVILLSPLLILSAILVKLSSPGPVFFVAPRYGKDGTTFPCYKFRSMRTDQDAIMSKHKLDFAAEGGRLLIHDADPRITRWGAIIRKTSIDELPQLFNVLRGEMSLVGPRPCSLALLDPFPELRDARAVVRPGISGLWQVRARDINITGPDMADDDFEYIERYSFLLDITILLRTFAVLHAGG